MVKRPNKVYIVVITGKDGVERIRSKYSSNCFYLRQSDAKRRAGNSGKVLEGTIEWKEVNYDEPTENL
jgi:hypothetical protein